MGFIKPIEKPSGMVFSYHRISTIHISTNEQNVISIADYVTPAKRKAEVDKLARMRAGDPAAFDEPPIFIDSTMVTIPYDPTMTVESAYEYLLTLPEFEGAEMEDTEYMLDAIETVPEIEAELAEQQQADIQQPPEEGDVE